MRNKRKRFLRKDPPNLKRFRADIEKLSSNLDSQEGEHSFSSDKRTGKSRKEKRKDARKLKKARMNAFHLKKPMPGIVDLHGKKSAEEKAKQKIEKLEKIKEKKKKAKEKQKEKKLEQKKAVEEIRKKQMLEETKREDRMLKQLEKQLHLKKRKSKNLPQSFLSDGLDYLLDVVDADKVKSIYEDENSSDLDLEMDSDDDLQESKLKENVKSKKKMSHDQDDDDDDDDDEEEEEEEEDDDEEGEDEDSEEEEEDVVVERDDEDDKQMLDSDDEMIKEAGDLSSSNESNLGVSKPNTGKRKIYTFDEEDEMKSILKRSGSETKGKKDKKLYKKVKFGGSDDDDDDDVVNKDSGDEKVTSISEPVYKEDIYGRLRDEHGNIVKDPAIGNTYIPPGKRLEMAKGDEKKKIQLERLKRQLKGLINRASESNMQPICSQVESIYLANSRAEVSETLTSIILDACISTVLTPDRLAMELMMMIAVLHSNIGTEVGAVFIQSLAQKFESLYNETSQEGKQTDNVILLFAHLYNFKIIHNILIYDILKKLTETFREKDIELILLLLKNVGFTLRKDDPNSLKEMIVQIHTKANTVDTGQFHDQSRVRFMLDVLLAIKNNNMRKIPNYDPDHMEHLKKMTRSYIKGKSLGDGQLRISLEDLSHAEDKGRWWVVGSAWEGRSGAGKEEQNVDKTSTTMVGDVSTKIMDMARKQRMNTEIRKNVFCVIMTSEDFVDAFEKLIRLGLKNQSEREIIHVIMDCCQQEKQFNPFYAYLMQKFCEYDRRFQMTFQFSMWDKFKEMQNISEQNRNNLAKLTIHLLATKAISLTLFKVVEFGTLDKAMVRFMKQVLQGILLDYPDHVTEAVFIRIAPLNKLHMLQEGLKLFMHHFLLRKKSKDDSDYSLLKDRINMADKALSSSQSKMLL